MANAPGPFFQRRKKSQLEPVCRYLADHRNFEFQRLTIEEIVFLANHTKLKDISAFAARDNIQAEIAGSSSSKNFHDDLAKYCHHLPLVAAAEAMIDTKRRKLGVPLQSRLITPESDVGVAGKVPKATTDTAIPCDNSPWAVVANVPLKVRLQSLFPSQLCEGIRSNPGDRFFTETAALCLPHEPGPFMLKLTVSPAVGRQVSRLASALETILGKLLCWGVGNEGIVAYEVDEKNWQVNTMLTHATGLHVLPAWEGEAGEEA